MIGPIDKMASTPTSSSSYEKTWDYCIILTAPDLEREVVEAIKTAYETLQHRDNFPVINQIMSAPDGPDNYGLGINDTFSEEIVLLTEQFPDHTFLIYYFHHDMTALDVFEIRRGSIKQVHHLDQNTVSVPGGNVSFFMDPDTLEVPGIIDL